MRKNLQTTFSTRQYMVAQDFEIYYYNDQNLEKVALHSHDYYEFYFSWKEMSVSRSVRKHFPSNMAILC